MVYLTKIEERAEKALKKTRFKRKVARVFEEYGIHVSKLDTREFPDLFEIEIISSRETPRKTLLLRNLRNIQIGLRTLGYRLILWKDGMFHDDGLNLSLGSIRPARAPEILCHVTMEKNVPSILEQGLLPRPNFDCIVNAIPAIFMFRGRSRYFMSEIRSCVRGYQPGEAAVLLEVDRSGIEVYTDYEYVWHERGCYYSTKRIPPERIRRVEFPEE